MEFVIRVLIEPTDVGCEDRPNHQQSGRNREKTLALEDQLTQLTTAVADVKQASDEEAVRVEAIIVALQQGGGDNQVVAQAIAELGQTAAALRAFHADTPVAG